MMIAETLPWSGSWLFIQVQVNFIISYIDTIESMVSELSKCIR